jgi:hypothetical protein
MRNEDSFQIPEALLTGSDADVLRLASRDDHAVVVDWREEDAAIVELVSDAIGGGLDWAEIEGEPGLELRFGERTARVVLTESPMDRYLTLRGVARVLEGAFELRLFRASYASDTHVFYVRSVSWWREADRRHGDVMARVFRPLDDELDFP